MQTLIDLVTWLDDNLVLSAAVVVAWVVMLVVSVWAVHRFLITIPADYFAEEHKRLERGAIRTRPCAGRCWLARTCSAVSWCWPAW